MSKTGLIFETLNDVKQLNKRSEDGLMHLSGVFGVCGVKNNNQRIYETANYAKMVKVMQERLKSAPIPGELEHPTTMNINTENISHRIDSINIDENGVVSGEITLLDTPKGKIAQAIVEGGLPLFISSRAQGSVSNKGIVTLEHIATYDLVGSPGFSQAELHLNENQVVENICESMCIITDNIKKDTKEDQKRDRVKESRLNDTRKIYKEGNKNIVMDNWILEKFQDLQSKINNLTEHINVLSGENIQLKQTIKKLESRSQSTFEGNMDDVLDGIQKWIVEEYSPEVQKWIVNEYSPEVQKWIVNEYSPEVQKWIVEEYSPEVEKWIVNEYSPEVEGWVKDEVIPHINEGLKETSDSKLEAIDNVLSLLESHQTEKPKFGRKSTMIAEANDDDPKYIREMPTEKRIQWNMASKEVRESIERRAKLYNFNNDNAIQNFWESVNFTVPEIHNVNEGIDNITDEWEKNIRRSIRAHRK